MPRTTLPAIDPLAQLGIGQSANEDRRDEPLPPKRGSVAPPPPPDPTSAPRATDAPKVTPVARETIAEEGRADAVETPQETPAVRFRTPATTPKRRVLRHESSAQPDAAPLPLKLKFNARVPAELVDEVRNCVVALYSSHGMTIDSLTTEALRREVERLKRQENEGKNFPKRHHDPKPGRPVR